MKNMVSRVLSLSLVMGIAAGGTAQGANLGLPSVQAPGGGGIENTACSAEAPGTLLWLAACGGNAGGGGGSSGPGTGPGSGPGSGPGTGTGGGGSGGGGGGNGVGGPRSR